MISIDHRPLGHNDTLPACAFGGGHTLKAKWYTSSDSIFGFKKISVVLISIIYYLCFLLILNLSFIPDSIEYLTIK